MAELFRELGLPERNVLAIIRNPIYIGEYHYRGKVYHFPELAIIDKKLWEECQPVEMKFPRRLLGPKLFGFKRKAGCFVKDPETARKVDRIFTLPF